jgi:hypothetical protein
MFKIVKHIQMTYVFNVKKDTILTKRIINVYQTQFAQNKQEMLSTR